MKKLLLALPLLLFLSSSVALTAPPAKADALVVTCEDGSNRIVADDALAEAIAAACGDECSGSGSFLGLPTWYRYLDVGPETIDNGSGGLTVTDSCAVIGPTYADGGIDMTKASGLVAIAIVEILLRGAVIIALGFVIYGGFRYITSQGEPENTKSARQTIINALIGLVLSLIATGLVAFIASQLTS